MIVCLFRLQQTSTILSVGGRRYRKWMGVCLFVFLDTIIMTETWMTRQLRALSAR